MFARAARHPPLQRPKRTRIGVQRGATYFKEFDTDSTLNKQVVTEDILNFRKLAQGRIDVVIATESQGDYLISSLGLNSVLKKCSYRHDKVMPVHFVISKQSPLMSRKGEIDKAARRLRTTAPLTASSRTISRLLPQKDWPLNKQGQTDDTKQDHQDKSAGHEKATHGTQPCTPPLS